MLLFKQLLVLVIGTAIAGPIGFAVAFYVTARMELG